MATLTILHLRNPVTGGQYRKTLQHGFHMQSALDWRMGQVLNGLDPNKRSDLRDQDTLADMYACAFLPPNYPVPAIRAMVNNAQRLIDFGNISAENGFDIATVFERYVKL